MKLKIKEGTDLTKYGFKVYKGKPKNFFINCSKGDLAICVEVEDNILSFHAEIDASVPDLDNYYDFETKELNISNFTDDVYDITCQHQEIKQLTELLADLLSNNVLETE